MQASKIIPTLQDTRTATSPPTTQTKKRKKKKEIREVVNLM
jgi:hypothetical protein